MALIGFPLYGNQFAIPAKGTIAPPASAATKPDDELTKYEIYTRSVVSGRWHAEIKQNETSLWFGEVKIHCTFHSDGTISDAAVVLGDSTGLLKTVCMHSLLASVPLKRFNATLFAEVGESFTDDIDFTVAQRPPRPSKDWTPINDASPASTRPLD